MKIAFPAYFLNNFQLTPCLVKNNSVKISLTEYTNPRIDSCCIDRNSFLVPTRKNNPVEGLRILITPRQYPETFRILSIPQ